MALADVIAKVRGLKTQKTETAVEAYRAAVVAAGQGKAADPAKTLAVIEAVGKTLDDFEADAAAVARRIAMKAKAAEIPRLQKATADATARLNKLDADHNAAIERYFAARLPLVAELDALQRELKTCDDAREEVLGGGYENAEIRAEKEKLLAEEHKLSNRFHKLDLDFKSKAWVITVGRSDSLARPRPEDVAAAERTCNEIENEQAAIVKRRAEIAAALAALEERALSL